MIRYSRTHAGFSLIELMIVVVIVGILATIAYPSYLDQVRKSRRTEARALLLKVSGMQQRFFTENNTYALSMSKLGFAGSPRLNADGSVSSEHDWYRVTTEANNAADPANPTFTVTAEPQRDQIEDDCASLTINQLGEKTSANTIAPANCW